MSRVFSATSRFLELLILWAIIGIIDTKFLIGLTRFLVDIRSFLEEFFYLISIELVDYMAL